MRYRIMIGSGLAVVFGLAFLIGNSLTQAEEGKREVVLGYVQSAPISQR